MTPERWQIIKALFQSALKLTPSARPAFLDRACEGDESLHQEVQALLDADGNSESINLPVNKLAAEILAEDRARIVGTTIAHYKILSLIGVGGMGEVYLAQDTRLGRKVALKFIPTALSRDEERLRRFEREARSASALNHPNVCVIYEIGVTDEGRHFIAMEYIEGTTLRERLLSDPVTILEAVDISLQAAAALSAAHEAGVVHRDIKPENLILRRDGFLKVLDFGLAKLTERYAVTSDSQAPTIAAFSTQSGLMVGTANYLSPEQARRKDVDERSDIWSLGVVLYEMLTGSLPFAGETPNHIIVAIIENEPQPLSELVSDAPPQLEWIVKKALRKDRDQRYQTARDLHSDLNDVKQTLFADSAAARFQKATPRPGSARTSHSSAFESIAETLRRPRLSLAFFVLVMLAVAIVVWFIFQHLRNKAGPLFQNLEVSKLTNTGNVVDAAISPDGKYVVYVVNELGKQSLWARHVATASSVMIAAPEAVEYDGLTFSKDSNYVYYVRREQDQVGVLYQVAVLGGAIRKMLRDVDSAITFSDDGKRLAFIRHAETKSYKLVVFDTAGEQDLVSADKNEVFASPSWSPDGKRIAYALGNYSGEYHMTLVTNGLDGRARELISPRQWYSIKQVCWLGDSSGLIVNATEQPYGVFQLWYVAYPSGDAQRITNDLNNYRAVSLTESADTLVTVKSDTATNIWLLPLGDIERAKKLVPEVGKYFGLSWVPDGRIALSSMASGNPDIWLIGPDGRSQKQLTSNNGANYHPDVSPDGRYIAFTGYRGGVFSIWRMDADGGNQIQLTKAELASFPAWSPDGQWIYYQVQVGATATLWKVDVSGSNHVQVTSYYSRGPVVSPDGRFLACTYWDDKTASLRYAVIPADGGTPVMIFGNLDPKGQRMARWTSDGQALLFVDKRDVGSNVWSQPLNGSPPKQITNYDADQIFDFDLSPDGRQLLLTRGSSVSDAVLMRWSKRSS